MSNVAFSKLAVREEAHSFKLGVRLNRPVLRHKATCYNFLPNILFAACGDSVLEMQGYGQGVLKSPNYPCNYTNWVYCEWTLVASQGHTVSLSFDHLDIEDDASSNCSYDFVQVLAIF